MVTVQRSGGVVVGNNQKNVVKWFIAKDVVGQLTEKLHSGSNLEDGKCTTDNYRGPRATSTETTFLVQQTEIEFGYYTPDSKKVALWTSRNGK